MRKLPIALAVLAALSTAAHADTYSFTISTAGSAGGDPAATFLASGTLTGSPVSTLPPTLLLSDVTGSAQGYAFTGVVPLGTVPGFTYDNLLFTDAAATHVDSTGILLYLDSPVGTSIAHVYNSSGYHVDVFDPRDPGDITPFTIDTFIITPSTVPEPSSLALLGTGAVGLLAGVRRKLTR